MSPVSTKRRSPLFLIDRITGLLDSGTQIVVVSGPPGVGKTALAVRVAHQMKHRFPDGQLHVNLHGYSGGVAPTTEQVLARFLRALGVPTDRVPTEVDEQATMLRSELAGPVREFTAAVGRDALIRRRLRDVADKLCDGAVAPLLMSLVEAGPVTDAELAELRALVRKLSKPSDPTS